MAPIMITVRGEGTQSHRATLAILEVDIRRSGPSREFVTEVVMRSSQNLEDILNDISPVLPRSRDSRVESSGTGVDDDMEGEEVESEDVESEDVESEDVEDEDVDNEDVRGEDVDDEDVYGAGILVDNEDVYGAGESDPKDDFDPLDKWTKASLTISCVSGGEHGPPVYTASMQFTIYVRDLTAIDRIQSLVEQIPDVYEANIEWSFPSAFKTLLEYRARTFAVHDANSKAMDLAATLGFHNGVSLLEVVEDVAIPTERVLQRDIVDMTLMETWMREVEVRAIVLCKFEAK